MPHFELWFIVFTTFGVLPAVIRCQSGDTTDDIVFVSVLFRHGDRTPIDPYPMDPYRNRSYWPVDFGQLTNLGKSQEYAFGTWLRTRYAHFLPPTYSECDISVRSTDVDRTLMSAQALLAGLYPPMGEQQWNHALRWQPIPVHTAPEHEDALLAMKKPCARYEHLLEQLARSAYFVNVSHANSALYAYLTQHTGRAVNDLKSAEYIHSTLFVEQTNNFTLPQWTDTVYPQPLRSLATLSFAVPCYTAQMARLKCGVLIGELLAHMRRHRAKTSCTPRFRLYAAHDTTVANLLQAFGVFAASPHCPAYTSAVIIELRRKLTSKSSPHPSPATTDVYYVNVLYRRNTSTTQLEQLRVGGCAHAPCTLDEFQQVFGSIALNTVDEWAEECAIPPANTNTDWYYWSWADLWVVGGVFLIVTVGAVLIVWCALAVKNRHTRGCKQEGRRCNTYIQLPDNDDTVVSPPAMVGYTD